MYITLFLVTINNGTCVLSYLTASDFYVIMAKSSRMISYLAIFQGPYSALTK